MHLPTILSTLLTVAFTSQTAIARPSSSSSSPNNINTNDKLTTRQDDPPVDRYILNWRVFGATGCFEKNWGVGTLTSSELDICIPFTDDGIKAINLTNIVDGCSFRVYTGRDCDGQSLELKMGSNCGGNIFDEELSWLSQKATCP